MLEIRSKQNAQLKQWRKLLTTKGRKKTGEYLIEGEHLVEEAIVSGAHVKYLLLAETYWLKNQDKYSLYQDKLIILADNCIEELSQTQNSQGVFAILKMKETNELPEKLDRILIIDAVQDPGNLGTLIRTADAANFDAVILGSGTVDLYNDKVIRSTQGSMWHLPVIQENLKLLIPILQERKINVLATALHHEAKSYTKIDYRNPTAIILGNEGQGVNQEYLNLADQLIYIPMTGRAESLNVAIAGGIIMFKMIEN